MKKEKWEKFDFARIFFFMCVSVVYLSSMRSCAKMSLPGQWMDLQMSPIISTSSHELSSSCTWSWRESCRKPLEGGTRWILESVTEMITEHELCWGEKSPSLFHSS